MLYNKFNTSLLSVIECSLYNRYLGYNEFVYIAIPSTYVRCKTLYSSLYCDSKNQALWQIQHTPQRQGCIGFVVPQREGQIGLNKSNTSLRGRDIQDLFSQIHPSEGGPYWICLIQYVPHRQWCIGFSISRTEGHIGFYNPHMLQNVIAGKWSGGTGFSTFPPWAPSQEEGCKTQYTPPILPAIYQCPL